MTKIIAFDRKNMSSVSDEINAALKAVADKHGISLAISGMTWMKDGSSGMFKVNAALGEGKTNKDQRLEALAKELDTYHTLFFPDLKLDATYRLPNGSKHIDVKIVGYNRKGRTAPVIVQVVGDDSKTYKVSTDDLRNAKVVA